MSTLPYFSRGIAYAKKSFAIREAKGDLWGQGQSLHFHGVVLFAASRFEECAEKCREAVSLLERTGDKWEAHMARYHLADSLFRLGRLSEAVAEGRRIYQSAKEVGDAQAMGLILIVWGAAASEAFPIEELEVELARPREDPLATLQLIQAKGLKLLLHDKRPNEAAEVFGEAICKAKERGIKNTYVMANYAWRATALRQSGEARESGSPARKRMFRQAQRAAARSLKMARIFQNDLPHALRENAIMASYAGREAATKALLEQSLAVSQRQNAVYQRAQTLLAKAEAGIVFDWVDAEKQLVEAQLALKAIKDSVLKNDADS